MKSSCTCGATGIYHWWYCNATPEYLEWMKNHKSGEMFRGQKYKDDV